MIKDKFLLSATVLAIGGVVAKAIGAFYRVPLLNILGAEGMGIYQLIFPLYSLLLTISCSALPVAISKTVCENIAKCNFSANKKLIKVLIPSFLCVGLFFSLVLFLLSDVISSIQGNKLAGLSYKIISPSIAIVCVISVVRGYFQGRQNMFPTSLSQIVEQAVKLVLGLYFASILMPDLEKAVAGAVLAVTISEVFAFVFLVGLLFFSKSKRKINFKIKCNLCGKNVTSLMALKSVFKLSIPIMVGSVVLPISQIVDSILCVNIISSYNQNATALYGLMTGAVFSVLSLPQAVCFSIGVATVPTLAKQKILSGNKVILASKINRAIFLTMLVAIPSAIGIFVMSDNITNLLYPNLSQQNFYAVSTMFKTASLSVVFLSLTQTLVSVLQGLGKVHFPVIAISIATVIKFVFNLILLNIKEINIYGAIFSTNICYLVAVFLNLVYIIKYIGFKPKIVINFIIPLILGLVVVLGIYALTSLFNFVFSQNLSFIIALVCFMLLAIFAVFLFVLISRKNKKVKSSKQ